eukprot:4570728-Lingulodinium_polyedra.AAC.1
MMRSNRRFAAAAARRCARRMACDDRFSVRARNARARAASEPAERRFNRFILAYACAVPYVKSRMQQRWASV